MYKTNNGTDNFLVQIGGENNKYNRALPNRGADILRKSTSYLVIKILKIYVFIMEVMYNGKIRFGKAGYD